jgi:ABC-type microcin C transport system permease subunit YejE
MIWPPIRYSYRTVNSNIPHSAPAKPFMADGRCDALRRYPTVPQTPPAPRQLNWLGTDDQARDVLARIIYGFRISVLFGLVLTARIGHHRRVGRRRAGLFRRLDRPDAASASSRSGRRCRCST